MSPKAGGSVRVGGSQPMRTDVYTGAQINFGDLAQYLTYASSTAGMQFLLRVILFLRILLGERIARELVLRYSKLTSLLSILSVWN
jgi:hypothetical protein